MRPEAQVLQTVSPQNCFLCQRLFAHLGVTVEEQIAICMDIWAQKLLHEPPIDIVLHQVQAWILKVIAFNLPTRQELMNLVDRLIEVLFVFDCL